MAFVSPLVLPGYGQSLVVEDPAISCSPCKPGLTQSPFCMAKKAGPARSFRLLERPYFFPVVVQTAQSIWHRIWDTMMAELAPSDDKGSYSRPKSMFTGRLNDRKEGAKGLTLYVGIECPWCHRVLLLRQLLGIMDIEVKWCRAGKGGLWELEQEDEVCGRSVKTVRDVYLALERNFRGRATVPLLIEDERVLCNESAELLQELPKALGLDDGLQIKDGLWICMRPKPGNKWDIDSAQHDELCENIYAKINNGVYKCGFARNQEAYDKAVHEVFSQLDDIETLLGNSRFLLSNKVITEADVRLFPTIYRFDTVYASLFRANLKSIAMDYPAISAWARDMYSLPGVADTCDLQTTKESYFTRLFPLNPGGIVPAGPLVDFEKSQKRAEMAPAPLTSGTIK